MSFVNHAAEVLTIDCLRDRPPEFGRREPSLLVCGQGREGDLVEPQHLRFQPNPGIDSGRGRLSRDLVERVGVQRVDEIDFAAAEAHQFHIAILLNLQTDAVQVGQPPAAGIELPVARIASQQQFDSGLIIGDGKRTQHRGEFFGRAGGENRDLVEQTLQSGNRRAEPDRHRVRRRHLNFGRDQARTERIGRGRVELGVHQTIHRVRHVVRAERSAVGKSHVMPQLKRDTAAIFIDLPGHGQLGDECLRDTLHAQECSAGEIADRLRVIVLDHLRVKCLGIGAQGKAEFAAGLGRQSGSESGGQQGG